MWSLRPGMSGWSSLRERLMSEAKRAEVFARDVVQEMLKLRGWSREHDPLWRPRTGPGSYEAVRETVVSDIFAELAGAFDPRIQEVYSQAFSCGRSPASVARELQDRIWWRCRDDARRR